MSVWVLPPSLHWIWQKALLENLFKIRKKFKSFCNGRAWSHNACNTYFIVIFLFKSVEFIMTGPRWIAGNRKWSSRWVIKQCTPVTHQNPLCQRLDWPHSWDHRDKPGNRCAEHEEEAVMTRRNAATVQTNIGSVSSVRCDVFRRLSAAIWTTHTQTNLYFMSWFISADKTWKTSKTMTFLMQTSVHSLLTVSDDSWSIACFIYNFTTRGKAACLQALWKQRASGSNRSHPFPARSEFLQGKISYDYFWAKPLSSLAD